jgi:hypothetical protein
MIVVPVSLFYDHEHDLIIQQLSVGPYHSVLVSLILLFHDRQSGLITLDRRSGFSPSVSSVWPDHFVVVSLALLFHDHQSVVIILDCRSGFSMSV